MAEPYVPRGLLDPESFVQNQNFYTRKICSGQVLGLAEDYDWMQYPHSVLRSLGMDTRTYGFYPLTLEEGETYAKVEKRAFPEEIWVLPLQPPAESRNALFSL